MFCHCFERLRQGMNQAETTCSEKKVNLPAAVRAATCARLWATGFIPLQACLSQYGGSWLLNGNTWPYAPLLSRSDFAGLPSQHPPAVFYAATPPPTPFSPILPLPILCPRSDPSSWILSEWHPLNLPNYLSSGHAALGCTFFSQGGAKGPKALQLDFLTTHQKHYALCDTLNPSLSSSKARVTGHRTIILFWIIVHQGQKCTKNCLFRMSPSCILVFEVAGLILSSSVWKLHYMAHLTKENLQTHAFSHFRCQHPGLQLVS